MNKLTIEYTKEKIKELAVKYECLSDVYVNARTKLLLRCDKGHEFWMNWRCFQMGQRCPECNLERQRLGIEYIKNKTKEIAEGYEYLSDVYMNSKIKLKFKCNNNHEFWMKWDHFSKEHRCPICWKEKNRGRDHSRWKGGVSKKDVTLYDTYAIQLRKYEEVRRDPENTDYLQVRCAEYSCKKWFTPGKFAVYKRISVMGKINKGECRFYCSDECKKNCSIFGQKKYPKGQKPYHSRQDQKEWADMVKERDNFECQRCGSTKKLVAHHMESLNENPIMSADIDIGITLCKKCHKLAHKEIGCRFVDMKKENICNKENTINE